MDMDCNETIRHLLQNDTASSIQALDAFGKVPAGVLAGNFEWLGDYDECTSLPDLQYCTINFKINPAQSNQTIGLMYGVCVPDVCSEDEIVENVDNITQSIPQLNFLSLGKAMFADSPVICQHFPQRPYDAGFICFTVFCLILTILMLLGAGLDVFQKYKKRKMIKDNDDLPSHLSYGSTGETNYVADSIIDETKPLMNHEGNNKSNYPSEKPGSRRSLFHEVLQCFAFNRNLSKLLDTSIGQSQSIGCLHGIRVISLSWVVLGHTFIFNFQSGSDNPAALLDLIPSFFFQAVSNAYVAVDSFFFLSGFLLSYLIFTRMAKTNGKISWFQFYFHRIWRITPLYAIIILFMIYYHPYFGDGPKWYQTSYWASRCEKYWWRNLLYINNLFPSQENCIVWSWYLACDMQFFIISPLILLPLYRSQTAGIIVTTILICAGFVVTGSLIGKNHFMTNTYGTLGGLGPGGTGNGKDYMSLVYTKPYARITPYLIGMILGYFIYRQISERQRVRLSPVVVSVGWALAFAAGMSVTYGTYSSYNDMAFQSEWTNAVNVIYGTFSRLGWSLALSWVIFACYYGYGGWINDFLSWSFWIPLSRLTFSAYLVHGLVIQTYYQAYPSSNHVSVMSSCYIFCGSLMLSYAAAVLFSIAIEYPCAGLEKLMLGKTRLRNRDCEKKPQQNNATMVT